MLVDLYKFLCLLFFHIAIDSNSLKEIIHLYQSFNMSCLKVVDLYRDTPLQYHMVKKDPLCLILKNRSMYLYFNLC